MRTLRTEMCLALLVAFTAAHAESAGTDANAHLVLPKQWLAMGAVRHFWTPSLRSNLALSALQSNNPEDITAGSVNRSATSAHLNLIWSPIAKANLGVEYLHATRTIENGQGGRLNRLQAAAQYFF